MIPLASLVLTFAIFWHPAVEARVLRNAISELPPIAEHAKTARYIIHNADWVAVGTLSVREDMKGDPFVSLKSISDGPASNSSGIPYLYMTDMDITAIDILANNKVTILASLAQSNYCQEKSYDPQDPRCAKVMLSGTVEKVNKSTEEHEFAKKALFERHPPMKYWPANHGFYVAKVKPTQILLLNNFGGLVTVNVQDYLSASL
ncbi:protein CREG1 [Dendroctonus ponderosae]|uniref:CREG-like beta-barrel domain-containing protein n=2 Tax=Dendroctonus ponderosae TaxID=77166 RepID=N6UL72_DENPD|nr:protein CREG1 [Dendroctonus ponderosae]ENN82490.1 hypothetical protein YQE_01137 [Dendroctonus ponderosae]KAH1020688.1 hypothetical protein HUJ04_010303 [Dendroctonus ponderosae]KAH1027707.1 hypothetical protein HUJ05_001163 [Dendroctonus ponderosae]